ncbi:hypothetical protein BRC2024_AWKCSVWU_CDS_0037 [Acinetobacter phage vB_AbaP_ABW132]
MSVCIGSGACLYVLSVHASIVFLLHLCIPSLSLCLLLYIVLIISLITVLIFILSTFLYSSYQYL